MEGSATCSIGTGGADSVGVCVGFTGNEDFEVESDVGGTGLRGAAVWAGPEDAVLGIDVA